MRYALVLLIAMFATVPHQATFANEKPVAILVALDMSGSTHEEPKFGGQLPSNFQIATIQNALGRVYTNNLCRVPFRISIHYWGDSFRVAVPWTTISSQLSFETYLRNLSLLRTKGLLQDGHAYAYKWIVDELQKTSGAHLFGLIMTEGSVSATPFLPTQEEVNHANEGITLYGAGILDPHAALFFKSFADHWMFSRDNPDQVSAFVHEAFQEALMANCPYS
ncbi:MAG: hypothetical protein AAGA35_03250 [Patescibacteria group bacterium]